MGKQKQTFKKAQALAMHYIPCCKIVLMFYNNAWAMN